MPWVVRISEALEKVLTYHKSGTHKSVTMDAKSFASIILSFLSSKEAFKKLEEVGS
jgi:hypothetical protein